jgi:hypothetical protein
MKTYKHNAKEHLWTNNIDYVNNKISKYNFQIITKKFNISLQL